MRYGGIGCVITILLLLGSVQSILGDSVYSSELIQRHNPEWASLFGYVYDTESNPIEGATIIASCGENSFTNTSDSLGYYYLDHLPLVFCIWNISASKEGYKTSYANMPIGENTTLDFILKSSGKTIYVDDEPGEGPGNPPENFTTIQDAINVATKGDTIFVYSGTYFENIVVDKSISLIGEYRDDTVIDGGGVGDVVSVCDDNIKITEFTINKGGSQSNWPWDCGIELMEVQSCIIYHNNISNNTYGIILRSSSNNSIFDNIISNNRCGIGLVGFLTSHPFTIDPSISNYINNNFISKNIYGVSIFIARKNNIINNTIFSNQYGIAISGCNTYGNILSTNRIFQNDEGICISDRSTPGPGKQNNSDHIILKNNVFENDIGINLEVIDDGRIEGVKILQSQIIENNIGITMTTMGGSICNTEISNCTIERNQRGIKFDNIYRVKDWTKIQYNTVKNNEKQGIYIQDSYKIILLENCIKNNNDTGIYLDFVRDSAFIRNKITDNKHGIYLQNFNDNIFVNNKISNNKEFGICLHSSENNEIMFNNIKQNGRNAYFENCKNNTWDGNYWNRPRFLPYPIFGKITVNDILIPWVNVDWHPALKPNDLGEGV